MFRIKPVTFVVLLVLFVCVFNGGSVGLTQQITFEIRSFMTSEEFEATGLSKLSAEEIDSLNRWLTLYTLSIIELVESKQHNTTTAKSERVIESRIKGTFNGWDGDTIFELQNGQIWQQDSYAYKYHYAYSPKVTIYRVNSRYKMKVEGVSDEIYVKRLK